MLPFNHKQCKALRGTPFGGLIIIQLYRRSNGLTCRGTIDRSGKNPDRFGFADENDQYDYELRQMPLGLGKHRSYRAVFIIKDDVVQVLTIRRASQDAIVPGGLPESI